MFRRVTSLVVVCLIYCTFVAYGDPLTSASVSEGACWKNISSLGARNVDLVWFGEPRLYYVPVASEHCYRAYAEVLLGRSAQNQSELDSMKLEIYATLPVNLYTSGFQSSTSPHIYQVCPPTSSPFLNQFMCYPVPLLCSPGTKTNSIDTAQSTVLYTDNNSTILFARCLDGTVRDYKVFSTEPTVTDATMEIITQTITAVGFNPKLLTTATY